jgi:hypothetical protein
MEGEKTAYPSDANSLFRSIVESAWMRLNKRQKIRAEKQPRTARNIEELVNGL